ncbi:MAG: Fic/DOC family N-terminal domain-containing protein, partial [Porphyromonadaceae bacterium]|nr:Fic/DOC family N-terminal domain-containing protein [Porphyromonadaceae bacterium]
MKKHYDIPQLPLSYDFETKSILKQVNAANRRLAELKGIALTIPNENILISTLVLQEALDSSAIENIITTSDELYKADLNMEGAINNAAAKEVLLYREAMSVGFRLAREKKLLSLNDIIRIQQTLERNNAGFRRVSGTVLKSSNGEVVYTPPQEYDEIVRLMNNLEEYINDLEIDDVDPLIKLAIIHHQFESIHPFYDGNGRTGRILIILCLIIYEILDLPILYLSRYITHNKGEYYRLIQAIRDGGTNNYENWIEWILFMLKGIEETALQTIQLVKQISALMAEYKGVLRPLFGQQYKHELLNNLFFHPYTKIEYMEKDMMVQRKTATKYLNKIVEVGLLHKIKLGRSNYYINHKLIDLFLHYNNTNDCV